MTVNVNKLNVKQTVFLSFGFLAASLAWSLYNSMVPQMLKRFTDSAGLIGVILVLGNIFGVVLEPTFGVISDRTRTRFGRRMPYIIAGIPICAVAFAVAPHMNSLGTLIAVLIVFCMVMAIWRTPTISLMPDLTPGPLRSQANGLVNFMGGVGTLIAFVGGGTLLNMGGFPLPFLVAGIVMLLSLGVMMIFVREPKQAFEPVEKKARIKLAGPEKKSLFLLLSACFFWFIGYSAVEGFFTLYATETLGVSKGNAAILLGVYSIAFMALAIPSGFMGARFGRRKLILIGLAGVTLVFIPMMIGVSLVGTIICLFIGGVFWAGVNINSLPMVLRMGGDHASGTYTGYYYLFSVAAQIIGPPAVGALIDAAGRSQLLFIPTADNYRALFLFSCLAFAIAFVVLLFVRHGEDAKSVDSDVVGSDEAVAVAAS